MSREAGRVRALLNAARLQHLLEAHDRIELLGLAVAKVTPVQAELAVSTPVLTHAARTPECPPLRLDA